MNAMHALHTHHNDSDLGAPVFEMRGKITTPALLLMHIMAGKSTLTAKSRKTGARYTFNFRRPRPEPNKRRPIWVSVMHGTEWQFLGTYWLDDGKGFAYRHSPKSRVQDTAPAVKAALWIARHMPAHIDMMLEEAEWWHEGRCGKCGKRLTVPESIATGFGPECAAALGINRQSAAPAALAAPIPAPIPALAATPQATTQSHGVPDIRHAASLFHQHDNGLTAEVSDLRGNHPQGHSFYRESDGAQALAIEFGAGVAVFTVTHTDYDVEGDLRFWELEPTSKTVRDMPQMARVKVTVFND